jgi:hypothetical protein
MSYVTLGGAAEVESPLDAAAIPDKPAVVVSKAQTPAERNSELVRRFETFKDQWRAYYSVSWAASAASALFELFGEVEDPRLALQRTAENNLALVQQGVDRVLTGDYAHAGAVAETIDTLTKSMDVHIDTNWELAKQQFIEFLNSLRPKTVLNVLGIEWWHVALAVAAAIAYKKL